MTLDELQRRVGVIESAEPAVRMPTDADELSVVQVLSTASPRELGELERLSRLGHPDAALLFERVRRLAPVRMRLPEWQRREWFGRAAAWERRERARGPWEDSDLDVRLVREACPPRVPRPGRRGPAASEGSVTK